MYVNVLKNNIDFLTGYYNYYNTSISFGNIDFYSLLY